MRNWGPGGGSWGRARVGGLFPTAPGSQGSPAGKRPEGLAGVHVSRLYSPAFLVRRHQGNSTLRPEEWAMLLIEWLIPVSYCARSFSNPYHSPVLAPILQMINRGQGRICDLLEVAQVRKWWSWDLDLGLADSRALQGRVLLPPGKQSLHSQVTSQGSSGAPVMWLPSRDRRASGLYDPWVHFHNLYLKKSE